MIPAACCLLAAVIMAFYPLNLKRTREIADALAAKRAQEGAGA